MRITELNTNNLNYTSRRENHTNSTPKAVGIALALALSSSQVDAFVKSGVDIPPSSSITGIDVLELDSTKYVKQAQNIEKSKEVVVSSYIKPENIILKQEYVDKDEKKYTLYFVNNSKDPKMSKDKKIVTDVFIVPEDFKSVPNKRAGKPDYNMPPKVVKLIGHPYFLGFVLQEKRCDKNGKYLGTYEYEVKLPPDIKREIFYLHNKMSELRWQMSPELNKIEEIYTHEKIQEHRVK